MRLPWVYRFLITARSVFKFVFASVSVSVRPPATATVSPPAPLFSFHGVVTQLWHTTDGSVFPFFAALPSSAGPGQRDDI